MERIDSLEEDAKTLIKICACFGFEFRKENLVKVAPQFLSNHSMEPRGGVANTSSKSIVVAVTGESSQMIITHQIITESAYSLMMGNQKWLSTRQLQTSTKTVL